MKEADNGSKENKSMGLVALLASNDDEKRGEGNEISPEYASVELETPRSSRIIDPSFNEKTSAVVPVDAQRRGLSLLLAQRQSLPQNGVEKEQNGN